jgi:folylpolyglutamate synthase/dihydropteroate synthase
MELRWAGAVPVLFDGAHVPLSLAQVVAEALADPRLRGAPVTVVAVHHEKDVQNLVQPLMRLGGRVLCTTLPTGVHHSADHVAANARAVGLQAEAVPDPTDALRAALGSVPAPGWVLATGSLYLVGSL